MARKLDPARVELRLESVVRVVRWSGEGVEIDVEQRGVPQRHRARKAIVTLPLGVLQAPPGDPAAVRFEPPLEMKREALAGLTMGPVHRVLLELREAFWERLDGGRMRDAGFITTAGTSTGAKKGLPFRAFWTQLPERRTWLVAWVGGPAAVEVGERGSGTSDGIIAQAVDGARELFGGRVDVEALLEDAWFHDWVSDPFSRGAYSYVNVGGEDARRKLAEPVAGALFIAGEATDESGEASTVAGAIAEGERVAGDVIAAP
jgi:monoamine oxidase